jgi:hypothetical protein
VREEGEELSICTKKKRKARPGDDTGPQTWGASRHDRGDFSLGGHRLSSLYRPHKVTRIWLTNRSSSWLKYSAGEWGREAPTFATMQRGAT